MSPRRLFSLPPSKRSVQRDIDDELRFHLESRIEELCARGMSAANARQQAEREFGDLAASRHELADVDRRRMRRVAWSTRLEAAWLDTRHALRGLDGEPGFTAAVIAVLALGIGANTAMVGVINTLLLTPPAHVAAPERLMSVFTVRNFKGHIDSQDAQSYPQYLDLEHTPDVFAGAAAYASDDLTLGLGADAQRARGLRVSSTYFATLGVKPYAGRFFLPSEEQDGGAPLIAVLSYAYWQSHYDSDLSVIGRGIRVDNRPYTIVGIAPPRFTGIDRAPVDMWVPITAGMTVQEVERWRHSRSNFWLATVARLAPGVSEDVAAAAATQVMRGGMLADGVSAARIQTQQPRFTLRSVVPWIAHAHDSDARVAILLGAVSLLVLLIACANVANLQLARGVRRRRDIAVRLALGVSRGRLVQRLAIEGAALALLGGVAAVVVAKLFASVVARIALSSTDVGDASLLDTRVLAYAAAIALLAGVVTGLVPALQAGRVDLNVMLRQDGRSGAARHSATRTVLLLMQAALSVVLLVGAGLFIRSLSRINALPLGLDAGPVLTASVDMRASGFTHAEVDAAYQKLLAAAAAAPGVDTAALTTALPFLGSWAAHLSVPGRDSLPHVLDGGPYFYAVTPGYFRTMGIRLLAGRFFTEADRNTPVIVLNESLAKLAWPNEPSLGKCIRIGADSMPCAEVIGIVANSRRQQLIEDTSVQFFIPISQVPTWVSEREIVIRVHGRAASHAEALRKTLQAAVPGLPYVSVRPLQDLINPQSRSWRMGAWMFGVFGLVALVLAMVGLYGLLAYDVSQRSHEIGVRVALGAMRGDVVRMIVSAAVRVMSVGVVAGALIALLAGRFVQPLLFDTSAREPVVFGIVAASMIAVAVLAAVVPTLRALAVDPTVAMRGE
jgi:predicted permease